MSCIFDFDQFMDSLVSSGITTQNDLQICYWMLRDAFQSGASMHTAVQVLFPEADEEQIGMLAAFLVSYCESVTESVTAAEPATAALLRAPETKSWAAKAAKATEAAPKAGKRHKTNDRDVPANFILEEAEKDGNCMYHSLRMALMRFLPANHSLLQKRTKASANDIRTDLIAMMRVCYGLGETAE
eukprot:966473-Rhodomonas_salina.1